MRRNDQIQQAHDILIAIVGNEVEIVIDDESKRAAHAALDVLCWVLEHGHNTTFAENIAKIKATAEQAGYKLVDLEEPVAPVNLVEGLLREMNRNRKLLEAYEKVGPAGLFGRTLIRQDIESAERALSSGDVVEMFHAFKALKGNK